MERIQEREIVHFRPEDVTITGDELTLIYLGKRVLFKLSNISPLLRKANSRQKENYRLSANGYGIHWPEVDEDISLVRLVKDFPEGA